MFTLYFSKLFYIGFYVECIIYLLLIFTAEGFFSHAANFLSITFSFFYHLFYLKTFYSTLFLFITLLFYITCLIFIYSKLYPVNIMYNEFVVVNWNHFVYIIEENNISLPIIKNRDIRKINFWHRAFLGSKRLSTNILPDILLLKNFYMFYKEHLNKFKELKYGFLRKETRDLVTLTNDDVNVTS